MNAALKIAEARGFEICVMSELLSAAENGLIEAMQEARKTEGLTGTQQEARSAEGTTGI